ncbi:1-phosphatidylinositol 4,5-bisphosphate phosphodiesterase-like [Pollicipes pollicipes]|uniref:1-phosphatidylinositol 4,5-bisphosphate phosphodiesterase-like n=1 Tax=Pollicipes pollicipes TaxID=41117 RepID=UPI0018851117|nr:1-phosphatidylinositol 4,5-bisphosphate phosphodiesterase-like [Pollicipes pollicipes]
MDALSDPRAFLSGQEKRAEQMKAMGIEEADIQAVKDSGSDNTKASKDGAKKDEPKKDEPIKFEKITAESLRQEKGFAKATKKQQKELETLKKRQSKERMGMQKAQCVAIEKLCKDKRGDPNDPAVLALVKEQIEAWSELMSRHRHEEWELLKEHYKCQEDILKKLMEVAQAAQIKQIEAKFERENKEMKARQAKVSVDTAKDVAQDKTLRNKAEKDRRLREKNQNNTKKFIEERKMAAVRQNKESEKLKKQHEQQMQDLSRDIKLSVEMYEQAAVEYELRSKCEFYA